MKEMNYWQTEFCKQNKKMENGSCTSVSCPLLIDKHQRICVANSTYNYITKEWEKDCFERC